MKRKLTINTLAMGNLKQRKKQYTILIISIILAMIFTSGVPFFVSCMNSSQKELQYKRQGKQEYIILNAQDVDFSYLKSANAFLDEPGFAHVLSYAYAPKGDFSDGTMVGYLDQRGRELYYPTLLEGDFPENEGEIAIEKTALSRMEITASVGDKITLCYLTCDGATFIPEEKEKTYTLTGILHDKKLYLETMYHESLDRAALVPAALVSEKEKIDLGGKEALVGFININYENGSEQAFYGAVTSDNKLSTSDVSRQSIGDGYSVISNNTMTLAFLSVLLGFMSCFGIVNAFSTNLKERKTQIGMLRAVGATKRQIIEVFGRETLLIALISAPVSVGISYFFVWLFAKIMGNNFIFVPNPMILLSGAAFGIVCVMLASLIPLVSVSRLSPLQAIRDIELMRKMKTKKIKSRKVFDMAKLLAKRRLTFSRGKQMSVCLILALTIIISCLGMSFLNSYISAASENIDHDYRISYYGMGFGRNKFINYKNTDSPLSENDKQEFLSLSPIKDVYGIKECNVNIIVEGKYSDYLKLNELCGHHFTSSRFQDVNDLVYSDEPYSMPENGSYSVPLKKDATEEIAKYMKGEIPLKENPDFTYTKAAVGYEDNIFNSSLIAYSEVFFELKEDDVIEGKINLEKLNSGEEIIINAPRKIGYSYYEAVGGGYVSALNNLDVEPPEDMGIADRESMKHIVVTAESPFKVGDEITLSMLSDDGSGNVKRTDRVVKIGAILGNNYYDGSFGIYTTLTGLNLFGHDISYRELYGKLKEECTAEIDERMTTELTSRFPGKHIASVFILENAEKQETRAIILAVVALLLVFIIVSITLINNSVTAQIREGKRTIGTLRAVGASQKELINSYIVQIMSMLLWGLSMGTVGYIISYNVMKLFVYDYFPIVLWPVGVVALILFLACYINLKSKIKTVMKHSIVENIREL